MAKKVREKLKEDTGSYFVSEKPNYSFVSSGCAVLDCVLGGGYPLGRMTNIVGDKSTSKTGLATEALINFMRRYPDGKPVYRDTEAAFDLDYAVAMGLKKDQVDLGDPEKPIITIEAFMREFDDYLAERIKTKTPGMYVIDSLDALSDEDEMDRDIGKGSYGTQKAKTLSIFFRTTGYKIEQSKVLLLIVSQVRDNIGAMFGEKYKRSGGHALDHHASQILWLSHVKTLKKTINKVDRPYGILVKAKAKKNKVGLPLRDAEFTFRFGYGIEDVEASVAWLKEVDRLKDADIAKGDVKEYLSALEGMSHADYEQERIAIGKVVKQVWAEIETTFLPTRQKYA
jgi:recombination protein RecA